MTTAAILCLLGLDGWRLLTTGDPVEAMTLQAVGEAASKQMHSLQKSLAVEIANAIARSQRG